jgi:uncharacterized protein (TIGR02145 family)
MAMNKILKIKTIVGMAFMIFVLFSCKEEEEVIPRPKLTVETVNPSAYGASDGSIDLTIEGLENTPYEVFWNNGETTEDISGLKAGNYAVKIIYLDKAVANRATELTDPAPTPLNLNFSVEQPSVWGYKNGKITLSISNGVEPYSFLWSNGATTQTLEKVKAGTYSVTVTDSNPHGAVSTSGTVVVEQPEFVCGRDSLMDVDGFKYPTVAIGDQCWTAVNIRTMHKPGWDPDDATLDEAEYLIDGRFCEALKCNGPLGAHYTWEAAVNGEHSGGIVQGIAPEGWHIPSRDDWKEFNDWLRIDGNGGPMTNVPNKIRGEDSSAGFDALYAGNWGYGVFTGELAAFWSSTELLDAEGNSTGRAYYRLVNPLPLLGEGHDIIEKGLSLRLIKD